MIDTIKKQINKQINQLQLADVLTGLVINEDGKPLQIEVDQRYILPPVEDAQLSAQIFVEALTLKGQLIQGDTVIMIKRAGSQLFYIIDWIIKVPR